MKFGYSETKFDPATADEEYAQLCETIKSQRTYDKIVRIGDIIPYISFNGESLTIDLPIVKEGEPHHFHMTTESYHWEGVIRNFLNYLSIPQKFYYKLQKDTQGTVLQEMLEINADKKIMIRCIYPIISTGEDVEIRAILSNDYVIFDAQNMITELANSDIATTYKPYSYHWSSNRFEVKFVHRVNEHEVNLRWDKKDAYTVGDVVYGGMSFFTSSTGTRKFGGRGFIGRKVCDNGMLSSQIFGDIAMYHKGAFDTHLGFLVTYNRLTETLESTLGSIEKNSSLVVTHFSRDDIKVENLEYLVEKMVKKLNLKKSFVKEIIDAYNTTISEAQENGYGIPRRRILLWYLANAFTLIGNDQSKTFAIRDKFQELGATLLIDPLSFGLNTATPRTAQVKYL